MNNKVFLNDIYPIISEQLECGGKASFTIHGTSMLPFLKDRKDKVWISKGTREYKKYDMIFYKREKYGFILHRIVKVTKDGYICRGDNQTDNEPILKREDIIAVVTDYERNGKKKPADSLTHRLYSRFWVNTVFFRKATRKAVSLLKHKKD